MSEADKQAWLASLFGGQAPSALSNGAPPARPGQFSNLRGLSALDDVTLGARSSGGPAAPDIGRSHSFGSFAPRTAVHRADKLPAPTLADAGAKSRSLTLSWDWRPPDVEVGAYGFKIEWRSDGEAREGAALEAPPARHTIGGLAPNTPYYVRVVAERAPDADGAPDEAEGGRQPSALSSADVRLLTLPDAPPPPQVVGVSAHSATLRWAEPEGGCARYSVYGPAALNFEKVYTGYASECEVTGLQPSTPYAFRVCALNALGAASEFSAEAALSTADASAAPPAPQLAGADEGGLSVRWGAAPAGGAGEPAPTLELQYRAVPAPAPGLAAPPPPSPWEALPLPSDALAGGSHSVRGLAPNCPHELRLLMRRGGGGADASEAPSAVLSAATAPAVPGTPTLLPERATPDTLAMRWAPPPGGCESYLLEMREPDAAEAEDREWALIYEGATAGCEISYLAPGAAYLFRAAALGEGGVQGRFGEVVEFITPLNEGEPPGGAGLVHAAEPPLAQSGQGGAQPPPRTPQPPPRGPEESAEGAAKPPGAGAGSPAGGGAARGQGRHAPSPATPAPPRGAAAAASPRADGAGARATQRPPHTPQPASPRRAASPRAPPAGSTSPAASPRGGAGGAKRAPPAPAERRGAAPTPPTRHAQTARPGRRPAPPAASGAARPASARGAPPAPPAGAGGRRRQPPPPPPGPRPREVVATPATPPRPPAPLARTGSASRLLAPTQATLHRQAPSPHAPSTPTQPHPPPTPGGGGSGGGAGARARRPPPRAPADSPRAQQPRPAPAPASAAPHLRLHALHAAKLARLEAAHAEREAAILGLATPRARRHSEAGAGAGRARSPRPTAAFASASPRATEPHSARAPSAAEAPPPGSYEVGSAFLSGRQLRRATVGASSAFRSASPRLHPQLHRAGGQADGPGPGAYEAAGVGSIAERTRPRRQRSPRAPLGSSTPRYLELVSKHANEVPGPGSYEPNADATRASHGTSAFGYTTAPRFEPPASPRSAKAAGPSPVYYAPR